MSSVADLKERLVQAEAETSYYRSLVETFFSGDIPEASDFNHHIMGKWGRKRLAEIEQKPALLRSAHD